MLLKWLKTIGFSVLYSSLTFGTICCGGGTGSTASADATHLSSGPAISERTAKDDKQAEEAKNYCEHEVKKSKTMPPEMLNKKQISACLIALRPQIRAECAKGAKREIILKIIVGNEGNVVGAFPVGDGADSAEASCVAGKVKPVVFPAFSGKEQQVIEKYPFTVEP